MPITSEITSTNLDNGPTTPVYTRNLSKVNFEVKTYNPFEVEPRKPGFLARILSGFGKILGPLAFAAAPFTGGLSAIAGMGLMGIGSIGDKAQANHYARERQNMQNAPATMMTFPGMMGAALASDPGLALVVDARNNAASHAVQGM